MRQASAVSTFSLLPSHWQTAEGNAAAAQPVRAVAREREVSPYSALAPIYDRLVGNVLFPIIRESFERCVGDYGIRFHSAADIGCGTGAFVQYLRRFRMPLIGVDSAPRMLRIAAH